LKWYGGSWLLPDAVMQEKLLPLAYTLDEEEKEVVREPNKSLITVGMEIEHYNDTLSSGFKIITAFDELGYCAHREICGLVEVILGATKLPAHLVKEYFDMKRLLEEEYGYTFNWEVHGNHIHVAINFENPYLYYAGNLGLVIAYWSTIFEVLQLFSIPLLPFFTYSWRPRNMIRNKARPLIIIPEKGSYTFEAEARELEENIRRAHNRLFESRYRGMYAREYIILTTKDYVSERVISIDWGRESNYVTFNSPTLISHTMLSCRYFKPLTIEMRLNDCHPAVAMAGITILSRIFKNVLVWEPHELAYRPTTPHYIPTEESTYYSYCMALDRIYWEDRVYDILDTPYDRIVFNVELPLIRKKEFKTFGEILDAYCDYFISHSPRSLAGKVCYLIKYRGVPAEHEEALDRIFEKGFDPRKEFKH